MLIDASSATMYANTCGTRILTTLPSSGQTRHLHRRVFDAEAASVVVTGLSRTGDSILPHFVQTCTYQYVMSIRVTRVEFLSLRIHYFLFARQMASKGWIQYYDTPKGETNIKMK